LQKLLTEAIKLDLSHIFHVEFMLKEIAPVTLNGANFGQPIIRTENKYRFLEVNAKFSNGPDSFSAFESSHVDF
jgi:hypothetical protein